MFENVSQTEKTVARSRGRAILFGGTALVLLLAVIIVLFAKSRPEEPVTLEGAARAGAADFESYKDKVEVEITAKNVYDNMIGMFQIDVRAKIHNRGDRPITGLELVGKMLSLDDKIITQRISIPIPRARPEPLKPGESLPVSVKLDAPAKITENDIKDVTIELQALKFQ
jgi:biopolymer transport protein ExbD